jgi:DNA topoisomerase VI subunit B
MTVSAIASDIYQNAKLNNYKGEWDWRAEWSKAMKQAHRKVAQKISWKLQEEKRIEQAKAKSAQIKENMERNATRLSAMTEEEKEQASAAAIYEDYQVKWSQAHRY